MGAESKICSIMFADIVGSSKIRGDALKAELTGIIETYSRQTKEVSGVLYSNTWGDAVLVVGSTARVIADEALRLLDRFKNEDWEARGYAQAVQVRVGLDANAVVVKSEEGRVAEVSGQGVDAAARIEPIVDANRIWCSPSFKHLLLAEGMPNVDIISVGERELPKGAGNVELFDLHRPDSRPNDADDEHNSGMLFADTALRTPKIRRQISGQQRDTFLRESFATVKRQFEAAALKMAREYDEVDASFQVVHALKFVCDVYVDGESAQKCKIWLSLGSPLRGIGYAAGNVSIDNDNTFNELIDVKDDGHEMFLSPMGMQSFGVNRDEKMNANQAANHLWEIFIRGLEV